MTLSPSEEKLTEKAEPFREDTSLLVLAYYFPPLNTSGAQRPFRFVKYLERQNLHAHVVTASPQEGRPEWHNTTQTSKSASRSWIARIASMATVCLQRILPYNDQLPWIPEACISAMQVAESTRPAAIFSTSPPVASHAAALFLKKRLGIPWIADFRDPFFANPLRPRKLSRPYEAVLERMIMRDADAVIANTDAAAETLRQRYPGHRHKIEVIWNGYDPEEQLAARPLPKRRHKTLLHAGSIYGGRHPGALIASLNRLIQSGRLNPDIVRLRLIGWMEPTAEPWTSSPSFVALQSRGCLEFVNEAVPLKAAMDEMMQADYLLLLDLNDTGAAVQVPAKVFQYIRIGRPILSFTSSGSPTDRIIAQSGIPHVSIYRDLGENEMDRRVEELFGLSSNPTRPSTWFEGQFNAQAQTQTLASILRRVTTSKSVPKV